MVPRLRPVLVLALALGVMVTTVGAPSAGAKTVRAEARPDPVLLVHGFRGSSSGWHDLSALLLGRGYRASEIDAIDYDSDASNVDVARQIAREVAALKTRTGARRVDVVSHSMGAISSRYYLERLGGAANVDAWVSLAGVNEGTLWAYGCFMLTPCQEMVPSSSMLSGLNGSSKPAGSLPAAEPRYGAWWSPCDMVIVPPDNARLAGAHNVETRCLDHTAVRTDPRVLGQVAQFLGAPVTGS